MATDGIETEPPAGRQARDEPPFSSLPLVFNEPDGALRRRPLSGPGESLTCRSPRTRDGKPVSLTDEEIESGRSPAGGWTAATLAAWGVPWPPPKGWRQRLLGPAGEPGRARSFVMGTTGEGNVIPPDEDWPPWEPGPPGSPLLSPPGHSDRSEGKAMTMTLFDETPAGTDPLPRGWKRAGQKAATGSPSLTPAEAARMYRAGMSACEIAHAYAITRQGAETKIREGGLGGVQWCPLCHAHEELQASL